MVVNDPTDVRKVHALKPGGFEDGKVSVVWNPLVSFVKDGTGFGTGRARGIGAHRPFIGAASFEHQAGAGGAAAVYIHHGANLFGPRMLVHENSRSDQPRLFSVVDKKYDGVSRQPER